MSGRLTTEVIDGARGVPAAGLLVDLFQFPQGAGERRHVRTVETNIHGGIDVALIDGELFRAATYELLFHVGRYFKSSRIPVGDGIGLEVIPVRFAIGDAAGDYCISLVIGPRSFAMYSTKEPAA